MVGARDGYASVREGHWLGGLVSVLGVVLALAELAHIQAMTTPLGIVVQAVLPFVGAVGLVVIGYILWSQRFGYAGLPTDRIVVWIAIGMGGLTLMFTWILSHQLIRGGIFHHPQFIFVNTLIAGAHMGFVIGTYDARSYTYQRRMEQEQLKHEFLHRELRHHILNGMQLILGLANRLETEYNPVPAALATIKQRGTTIVDRIESVRGIAEAFTDTAPPSLSDQNLSSALVDSVDRISTQHSASAITTDIPAGVTVVGDQFLSTVFENLLLNAVEHNDRSRPRVHVSLAVHSETVVVEVADNGPGIPDSHRASLLTWADPPGGDISMGVGLAIVKVLVDRYGGRVWMEPNEPRGTIACVELQRAA